jgi:hypothetical protein
VPRRFFCWWPMRASKAAPSALGKLSPVTEVERVVVTPRHLATSEAWALGVDLHAGQHLDAGAALAQILGRADEVPQVFGRSAPVQ